MGSQPVCGQWAERLLGRGWLCWFMEGLQWPRSGRWLWNCRKVLEWRGVKKVQLIELGDEFDGGKEEEVRVVVYRKWKDPFSTG